MQRGGRDRQGGAKGVTCRLVPACMHTPPPWFLSHLNTTISAAIRRSQTPAVTRSPRPSRKRSEGAGQEVSHLLEKQLRGLRAKPRPVHLHCLPRRKRRRRLTPSLLRGKARKDPQVSPSKTRCFLKEPFHRAAEGTLQDTERVTTKCRAQGLPCCKPCVQSCCRWPALMADRKSRPHPGGSQRGFPFGKSPGQALFKDFWLEASAAAEFCPLPR